MKIEIDKEWICIQINIDNVDMEIIGYNDEIVRTMETFHTDKDHYFINESYNEYWG